MASIISTDQRLSTSKRRLKPLMLRDYLLDDFSSCSSNGFKSFPRRPPPPPRSSTSSTSSSSSTVRRLLDAELKRSGLIHHHKPRLTRRSRTTCGTAITHAVHKASTAFLNAVKLLPFPSAVKSPGDTNKQNGFSRSLSKRLLSKSFWRKPPPPVSQSLRREVTEIQWWISAAFFHDEAKPSSNDLTPRISTVVTAAAAEKATFLVSPAAAIKSTEFNSGDHSSSSGSEFFTNSSASEVVHSSSSSFSSSSGETEEVSNENDGVEDGSKRLESRDCEGSSVNCNNSLCNNRKECMNEEKEQLSPVSILECPFEDDEEDEESVNDISHQKDSYENIARKSRRLSGLVRLEPLELEKRIEKYVDTQQQEELYHTIEIKEEESETRANRLFALVKSKIGETSDILASKVADNLLLDYLQEDNVSAKEETFLVKTVEDWVMGRQEEMFMSWQVREKREVYVKEMKWGCVTEDEKECVVEDLANGFFTSLVDEFIFDLA